MLPKNIVEQLIHTLISSSDYNNSLFTCLNDGALTGLQLVQNATVRLFTHSVTVRTAESGPQFKKLLKTHLYNFGILYNHL